MTSWRRAIPANRPIPDREGRAPSGRGHSLHLHYAVPGIIALHPHPLFHMVDGHAQQHQAETAAQIALEQEARLVADQPPGLIHSSTDHHESAIYRVLDPLASPQAKHAEDEDRKSVVKGKDVSVRVALGGRRTIKKKQKQPKT